MPLAPRLLRATGVLAAVLTVLTTLGPVRADADGLVARFPLDAGSGTTAVDSTGHGYDGTLVGDVTWADGALVFGGAGGHVKLPDDLLAGADAATVSAQVWVDPAQQSPYFLFGLGNTDAAGQGNGYLFATGGTESSGLRAAISDAGWRQEQGADSGRGLPRGRWATVTYTIGGGTSVLYVDGAAVARNNATTLTPGAIGAGATTANALGRSVFTVDRTFQGRMRNVEIHHRALSAAQVADLAGAAPARNPVLPGLTADPNIVVFGDTYYLYPTTDGFPDWSGSTFSAWSSKNLVDWTDEGVILDLGPDVSWAQTRAWAPAAVERNGRYYFYFCAEAKIGVAVADSPTGPFRDSGRVLIASNPDGGQAIDPAVFVDTDGTPYLYWGNGNAYVVPLNPDMVSFDPARITRITGLDGFREGLFMVERNGVYHLTWSIDDTRSADYRVGYATGPGPRGPFTDHGEVLSKDTAQGILGTGHSSMIQVPGADEWYLAYHRFAIPGGDGTHRETAIDRITFGPDGLMRPIVPTLEGVAPRPIR